MRALVPAYAPSWKGTRVSMEDYGRYVPVIICAKSSASASNVTGSWIDKASGHKPEVRCSQSVGAFSCGQQTSSRAMNSQFSSNASGLLCDVHRVSLLSPSVYILSSLSLTQYPEAGTSGG